MKYRFAIALVLNLIVVVALLGIGLDYVVSTDIKPHHREILDVSWSELTPRTQALVLMLMKGTGLVAILGAVSLSLLLAVPFRRRERWSRFALLIVGGTVLVPTLLGALRLRMQTGSAADWWPHLVLIACLLVAFWLTRDFGSGAEVLVA